jgi:hypothetical protein
MNILDPSDQRNFRSWRRFWRKPDWRIACKAQFHSAHHPFSAGDVSSKRIRLNQCYKGPKRHFTLRLLPSSRTPFLRDQARMIQQFTVTSGCALEPVNVTPAMPFFESLWCVLQFDGKEQRRCAQKWLSEQEDASGRAAQAESVVWPNARKCLRDLSGERTNPCHCRAAGSSQTLAAERIQLICRSDTRLGLAPFDLPGS